MIEVTIPMFLERFKVAEKRRKTYYKQHQDIPLKYQDPERYVFHQKSTWKQARLCEIVKTARGRKKMVMVIKNINSAGKPRWQQINGQDIWMGVHEQIRMDMVRELSESFKKHVEPHIEQLKAMKFPVLMDVDMYTQPKFCDWDLSNLWVYTKIFEDHLQRVGAIPNDNISYITKPAQPRFIPITLREQRKLVFKFRTDDDERVTSHLMYNLQPKQIMEWQLGPRVMVLGITRDGDSGTLLTNLDENSFIANIGKKKVIPGEFTKILDKIYWDCINLNCGVLVTKLDYEKYQSYLERLLAKGIQLYVI